MILEFLTWFWQYRYEFLLVGFLLYRGKTVYKKFIFDPLAGGNGKIQMDEVAKAALIIMIVRDSEREGESPEQLYPDIYWIMIFFALWAIAGLKPAFEAFKNYKNGSSENKT